MLVRLLWASWLPSRINVYEFQKNPGYRRLSFFFVSIECGNRGEVFAITSKQGSAEKSAVEHGVGAGEQSQSPGNMNGLWRWADASARDRARVGARVGGWA